MKLVLPAIDGYASRPTSVTFECDYNNDLQKVIKFTRGDYIKTPEFTMTLADLQAAVTLLAHRKFSPGL